MKGKQSIKCNVHSCKYCNCDDDCCDLKEIKITNQNDLAKEEDDTICSSYKLDKKNYEEGE